jgi:putative phosphoesterase
MRIALISDIHGNLVALETVLDELQREKPDRVVCLGDVACFGPQPRDVLARLRELKCPVVMGNTDRALLDPESATQHDPSHMAESVFWSAKQLSQDDLNFLQTFKPTLEVTVDKKMRLFCFHGSPQSDTDVILSTTPNETIETMFSGFRADVMAGGHTHTQMMRRYKDMLIINPGSVGLSHRRLGRAEHIQNSPWAEYALITYGQGQLGVALKRVPVDIHAAIQAALQSQMPYAARWAEGWR